MLVRQRQSKRSRFSLALDRTNTNSCPPVQVVKRIAWGKSLVTSNSTSCTPSLSATCRCITRTPDARDDDSGDDYLSVNRARYIHNWLVSKGISSKRLEYAGYGRTRPLVPIEINEADANRNRRVELRVLSR